MIIDVHSHAWQYPEHFTDQFCQQATQVAKANESLDLTIKNSGGLTASAVQGGRSGLNDGALCPLSEGRF